jgi:hypothetical protein
VPVEHVQQQRRDGHCEPGAHLGLRGAEDPRDSAARPSPQIPERIFLRFPSPTKYESRTSHVPVTRAARRDRSIARPAGSIRFRRGEVVGLGRGRRRRNPHRGGSGILAGSEPPTHVRTSTRTEMPSYELVTTHVFD